MGPSQRNGDVDDRRVRRKRRVLLNLRRKQQVALAEAVDDRRRTKRKPNRRTKTTSRRTKNKTRKKRKKMHKYPVYQKYTQTHTQQRRNIVVFFYKGKNGGRNKMYVFLETNEITQWSVAEHLVNALDTASDQ